MKIVIDDKYEDIRGVLTSAQFTRYLRQLMVNKRASMDRLSPWDALAYYHAIAEELGSVARIMTFDQVYIAQKFLDQWHSALELTPVALEQPEFTAISKVG